MTVLVASSAIPKGTSGSVVATKRLYTATTIRESQLREGAISDPARLSGRVATREIYEGAQLTASDFSTAATSLASQLTDRSGSCRCRSTPRTASSAGRGGRPRRRLRRLQRDPARGRRPAAQRRQGPAGAADDHVRHPGRPVDGEATATTVSLRVNDEQAAQLAFASDNGKVWLSLRPASARRRPSPASSRSRPCSSASGRSDPALARGPAVNARGFHVSRPRGRHRPGGDRGGAPARHAAARTPLAEVGRAGSESSTDADLLIVGAAGTRPGARAGRGRERGSGPTGRSSCCTSAARTGSWSRRSPRGRTT